MQLVFPGRVSVPEARAAFRAVAPRAHAVALDALAGPDSLPPRLERLFPRALLMLRLRFAGQGKRALLLLQHWLSPVSRLVVAVPVRCGMGA